MTREASPEGWTRRRPSLSQQATRGLAYSRRDGVSHVISSSRKNSDLCLSSPAGLRRQSEVSQKPHRKSLCASCAFFVASLPWRLRGSAFHYAHLLLRHNPDSLG